MTWKPGPSEEHVNEEVHERQHDGYNVKKEFMLLNLIYATS